ncbi:hypothetical protein BKA70DRAFT_1234970 [Coprinopsis sp. MPI-PUGE-AT-0042]|nr:hypothetical protein BKA70DRAFT_1234970 [Coprinopsis sp. MPI-PUGE-AT-0042]
MTSVFSIKYKKMLGGPPNGEVEFELTDTSSGVHRRVNWQPTWGFGEFVYQTDSTSSTTGALGGSENMSTEPTYRKRLYRGGTSALPPSELLRKAGECGEGI